MTLRNGYVTTWDRLLLIGVGHKKTAEIIKIKISMSQLGAAGSNGLKAQILQDSKDFENIFKNLIVFYNKLSLNLFYFQTMDSFR